MYVWSALSVESGDRSGNVANPGRGQLNRDKHVSLCPRSRLRILSRETVSTVPSRVKYFYYIRSISYISYIDICILITFWPEIRECSIKSLPIDFQEVTYRAPRTK